MKRARRCLAVLCTLALAVPVRAHEGPPYPMFVDRAVGPYSVSLWGDPDVGTGTFWVLLDPLPPDGDALAVAIEVAPSSGRLPPARATFTERERGSWAFLAEFDREERWQVVVSIDGELGAATTRVEVAVTPPGYGRWDLLVYGAPFLALGALWIAVALRRRELIAEAAARRAAAGAQAEARPAGERDD